MDVDLYADPSCPWSWAAYQWLDDIAPRRQLRLRLRPYSLAMRDGIEHVPTPLREARIECHRALRVCTAIDDDSRRWEFYRALGEPIYAALRDSRAPVVDIAGGLAATGLDHNLVDVADDPHADRQIEASMNDASSQLRADHVPPRIPVLVLHSADDHFAMHGPLLDPAPTGHQAMQLWDAVERIAAIPGVYEISRPRPARHSLTLPPKTNAHAKALGR